MRCSEPFATITILYNRFSFIKTGVSNKDLTAAIVEATPPCKLFLWADVTIFSINAELDGMSIG